MGLVTDTLTVETSITGTGIESAADARITAQKGAANGICELDASSLIPANRLPSFVDDVLEYANLAAFPVTGATGKIYVALNTNKTYRWSGSVYIEISASEVNSVFGRTGIVTAQTGDYTPAQVGADPSGSAAAAQAFAIQRSNHTGTQTSSTISDFATTTRSTVLTGVDTTSTEIAVVSTDTVLESIGKLQGQINLWIELIQTTQLTNNSNTTLVAINELQVTVTAGRKYRIEAMLLYRSTATGTGAVLTAALGGGAAGTMALIASIPTGIDGIDHVHQGSITASNDLVTATNTPTANLDFCASIEGIFVCTTSGTLTPQFRSETNGQTITIRIGSNLIVREF